MAVEGKDPRTERRRIRHRNGRLWLVAIFLLLRPTDYFLLAHGMAEKADLVVAGVIITFLWTTGLLAAVWARFDWARYGIMVGMLAVAVLAGLSGVIAAEAAVSLRMALIGGALAHIAGACILANSAAIKDLVSRAKD